MNIKSIVSSFINRKIKKVEPLFGGDINRAYRITTMNEIFVLKQNSSKRFPEMFKKEKVGLSLLSLAGANVPKINCVFDFDDQQFILMEFIEREKNIERDFWINFGTSLAQIHLKSNTHFGLVFDNFIGSLQQQNTFENNWTTFFIEHRLQPLVSNSYDLGLLKDSHLRNFDGLLKQLDQLIPKEKPSLLHGDLWSGNILCGPQQTAYFIDPAVYFGHREVDIAMSFLFGGFDTDYLNSYQEVYPLEPDWKARIELHNLYPRLVHLLLFGSSYLQGIEKVIRKF
ncbi:fructosamine kinase family protein [Namhaeicola litoreus]|uniref:Fructosamine kinase family protein n=1 Tax=Namhaeicola litoreus TaxID=1052145 RepID=A0ABW3Y366_9FLAO